MVHLNLLAVLKASTDIPAEQIALNTADKKQISMTEGTEGNFTICVQVGDNTEVARVEDIDRLVRPIYKYVLRIDVAKEAALEILEVMSSIYLLKCGRSM